MAATLQTNFAASAGRFADRDAVVEPGAGRLSYAQLDHLSDRWRDHLLAWGIRPGDRVGIAMRKSANSVAVLIGALKAGAAYVPVDAGAPASRCAFILHDCGVSVIAADAALADKLRQQLTALGSDIRILAIDPADAPGEGLRRALDGLPAAATATTVETAADALAYVLYTSGSTGQPKGVTLSQDNAVSFVDWCSEVFAPTSEDRLSSHAPFHFDLSILDLHLCFKHGAALVLIGEDIGKDAPRLAQLIADEQISIWYSAPSILALLAQFGRLERQHYPRLRHVLFAGEVFAVKHLRALGERWVGPRYFNLYGPTETNVCTFLEVEMPVPPERDTPYPIGRVCSHLQAEVLDEHGLPVAEGDEGELCIAGRGVMQGYWGRPDLTQRAFHVDPAAVRWYRTGDVVVATESDGYLYRGRRDRMVKRRGFRIELGEIEAGLYRHAAIKEAAVIALPDEESGVSIVAFLAWQGEKRPSLIEIKRFCAEHLPLSMMPDRFRWQENLPKTSTDKIDYQRLKDLV